MNLPYVIDHTACQPPVGVISFSVGRFLAVWDTFSHEGCYVGIRKSPYES